MRIGLIIGTLDNEYCNEIAKFVNNKISSFNTRLVVFECRDINSDTPENTICDILYKHAGCDCLDGIIIAANTFLYQNMETIVKDLAKRITKPIVSMGLSIEGLPSVVPDYTAAFDSIISHILTHNINSFAYISGPLSNPVFNLRYKSFLDAIRKKDLNIPPDLVLEVTYGYLSGYDCAINLTPLIKNGSVKAVICACDDIAVSTIRCFSENNIDVPGDVIVSGFDNTGNDSLPVPYLTTINRNLVQALKKSISVLLEQISGNNGSAAYYSAPELVTGLSCGCTAKDHIKNDFPIPWTRFYGLKAMPQAPISDDIIPKLTKYLTLNNVSHCYIVKYCDPIVSEASADDSEKPDGILFYGFSQGETVSQSKPFFTWNILPGRLLKEINEPMLIKPIFINNTKFGYLFVSVSMHMAPLINDLGNELCQYFSGYYFEQELIRLRKENREARESLMISNKRLNELTVKDHLAKLENVRYLASNMLQKRKGITGEFILIIVEIENYYSINERFGFSEGEYVISCVSNILANSIRDDDYLSHQSFERYILLVRNVQRDPIQNIGKRFKEAINKLNQSMNKPYQISFCWGSAYANMESDIEEAYRKAEEKLLEAKQKGTLYS
ncbi:MAG: diguanylate cyclase domain-containing protein [Acetivibrionales bacterium]|jgi:diguanylate cyclase (GGDEF)-like protein